MNIKDVTFIASYQKESACPKDGRPEFAFIGRSNVGKSSLINMLTNKKGLAKVSVTPGKTQLINFFEINQSWYLVDLPGYGYARTSKDTKKGFQKMISDYLTDRTSLVTAFILIDCRHELQKIDKEFIEWCGENEVPFNLVFTKADKLGKNVLQSNITTIKKELLKTWHELPQDFVTSAETRDGRDDILNFISNVMVEINTSNSENVL
ncbi:MAG TPA: ribosome biogenesis GTP-binding protein YihA/YsxC [Saprospiraceae bacterium]|jgi:GTP-binding protein|nr:ribosome biogenesis GTP-binding protein YihA/YsxC [Saprospiraceae bacterium]